MRGLHLGLNLSGQLVRREGDNRTGFDDTSFDCFVVELFGD